MKTLVEEKIKSKEAISLEQEKQYRHYPEVINWEKIWERMEDEDLIKDVAEDFLLQNSERLKQLYLAVNSKNLEKIIFYSHSIKGAASTIAAEEVSEAAANIELAGNKNQICQIESLFTDLKNKFEILSSLISGPNWIEDVKNC